MNIFEEFHKRDPRGLTTISENLSKGNVLFKWYRKNVYLSYYKYEYESLNIDLKIRKKQFDMSNILMQYLLFTKIITEFFIKLNISDFSIDFRTCAAIYRIYGQEFSNIREIGYSNIECKNGNIFGY